MSKAFADPSRPPGLGDTGWAPGPGTGSPVLDCGLAYFDCTLETVYVAGDHDVCVGRVRAFGAMGTGAPLVFAGGGPGTVDFRATRNVVQVDGHDTGPGRMGRTMAKYLVLIYGDEQRWDAETAQELQGEGGGPPGVQRRRRRRALSGQELESSTTATTLRASEGGRPSSPTGRSWRRRRHSAASTSSTCPTSTRRSPSPSCCRSCAHGGVEVRPIVDHG